MLYLLTNKSIKKQGKKQMKRSLISSLILTTSMVAPYISQANEEDRERFIGVYFGAIDYAYKFDTLGVRFKHEFDNNLFIEADFLTQEETTGGIDNNALKYTFKPMLKAGYLYPLTNSTKLSGMLVYYDISVENLEKGGTRTGTYENSSADGKGIGIGLIHKITPDLKLDASYLRTTVSPSTTTTDSDANYLQAGLTYRMTDTFSVFGEYGRLDLTNSSYASNNYWNVGLKLTY
jgi:predicted porin